MNARISKPKKSPGFSLIETVIAIGVVAILLSGFLIVFAPAAAGIKDSINSKAATRLVNTLEQELVSLRGQTQVDNFGTGFNKAYEYIKGSAGESADPNNAILVYKYRASLSARRPSDGTPEPVNDIDGLSPGEDYVVRNMMRRKGEAEFNADIPAIEGPVYLVKCTQLIMMPDPSTGEIKLMPATPGQIANEATPTTAVDDPDNYNHAVVAFVADFYSLP
ncbi:MAG: type IV pilus modification PilV family protein, partial [Luteolibacter sp.]